MSPQPKVVGTGESLLYLNVKERQQEHMAWANEQVVMPKQQDLLEIICIFIGVMVLIMSCVVGFVMLLAWLGGQL